MPQHLLEARTISFELFARILQQSKVLLGQYPRPESVRALGRHKVNNEIGLIYLEQPSSRTRYKFQQALIALGASPIVIDDAGEHSSQAKGEPPQRLIKYLDAMGGPRWLIMRTRQDKVPQRVAEAIDARKINTSVVNAGDGINCHPSQVIGDALTLVQHGQSLHERNDVSLAIVGDNAYSRTGPNFASFLLRMAPELPFKVSQLRVVSAQGLELPSHHRAELRDLCPRMQELDRLTPEALQSDIIYLTRKQTGEANRHWQDVSLTPRTIPLLGRHSLVMHAGPAGAELPEHFEDTDMRCLSVQQARCNFYAAVAILQSL